MRVDSTHEEIEYIYIYNYIYIVRKIINCSSILYSNVAGFGTHKHRLTTLEYEICISPQNALIVKTSTIQDF